MSVVVTQPWAVLIALPADWNTHAVYNIRFIYVCKKKRERRNLNESIENVTLTVTDIRLVSVFNGRQLLSLSHAPNTIGLQRAHTHTDTHTLVKIHVI